MRNISRQYESSLNSAAEAANACLDMEGGAFLRAWTGELIRDLAAAGCVRSAALTAQKLCEAVNVEVQWPAYVEMEREEKQVWFQMFAETLMDFVKAGGTK